MPGQPKISVTVPVFNGERHLAEALESFLSQSLGEWELVAVDDASTDRSWEVLQAYAARDPRIQAHRHEENRGHRAASNTAFHLAKGHYLARCDQDDLARSDRLAEQVELLDRRPELGVIGSWYERLHPDGSRTAHRPPTSHSLIRWRLLFDLPFPHSSLAFRRSALFAGPGPYRFAPSAYDYEIVSRLARESRVGAVPKVLASYRMHAGGLATRRAEEVKTASAAISARELRHVLRPRRLARQDLLRLRRLGIAREVDSEDLDLVPFALELLEAFAAQPDIRAEEVAWQRRIWSRRIATSLATREPSACWRVSALRAILALGGVRALGSLLRRSASSILRPTRQR